MLGDVTNNFFIQNGKILRIQNSKRFSSVPFKEHRQFPLMVDVLARKNCHHINLHCKFPAFLLTAFWNAFLLHLSEEGIPATVKDTEILALTIKNTTIPITTQITIERDFQALKDSLEKSQKYLIILLSNLDLLIEKPGEDNLLKKQIELLISHPKCRVISITDDLTTFPKSLANQFTLIETDEPTTLDIDLVLRQKREELETYHHIIIPEELLKLAHELANRYLDPRHVLENTLYLLDSSSARTSIQDAEIQSKPVLSTNTLINVLSSWTQIPASCLQASKFKFNDFIESMKLTIHGQDAALTLIGQELQHAEAHAKEQLYSPFCSLLFVGREHTGKNSTIDALAEQLFHHKAMLYSVQTSLNSFTEIKLIRKADKKLFSLKTVLKETPYAIIHFEQVETINPRYLKWLHEILTTGFLHDDTGHEYDFRHAIIVLTTTIASAKLRTLMETDEEFEEENIDFITLLNREQNSQPHARALHMSPDEIVTEIREAVLAELPSELHLDIPIIPFLPLNKRVGEQIIRLKLKLLNHFTEGEYGVELSYAPEVLQFLVNEAMDQSEQITNIDKAVKQLNFVVEQAIAMYSDVKNRPTQLFLQLNETGQLLRAEWQTLSAVRHHSS